MALHAPPPAQRLHLARRGPRRQPLPGHGAAHRASDRRRRHRAEEQPARALADPPHRSRRRLVRLHLPASLPRRPRGARGAERPPQRHARPPAAHGLRQPRPDADRATRQPCELRLHARAGAAQHAADHERQRDPDDPVDRGHVHAVAAARDHQPRDGARARLHRLPDAGEDHARDVGRATARGRGGADRRRRRQRSARRQGVRTRAARGRAHGRRGDGALRVADAVGADPVAVPAAPRVDPDAGAGRDPRPRRVAGAPRADLDRHVPRLYELHRRPDGAGPAARGRPHDRAAGAGGHRAHLPAHRPGARDPRRPGG